MSKLPSNVTTDSVPTDCPESSPASAISQPSNMSGSPRQQRGRGARGKIPPDIRSVDSGYPDTMQVVVSDAVPSGGLSSMDSMNLHLSGGSSVDRPASAMETVSIVQEHLVHQIQKSVGGKGKQEDSSSTSLPHIPNSSSLSSCSSSADAQDVTEEDIQKLLNEMPPDMRVDFQDAMVLYSEDDRESVMEFVEHFSEIRLLGTDIPKVVLNDDIAISIGSKFKALEFGLDRCTYVFLFITKSFCVDSWAEFSSETCLMEAIHNPDKKWCVVPVFTEPKRKASFRIPPSLNSLKGIQYWTNDKFFRDSVQKLLEEKLYIRRKNEKQLTRERKEWVTKWRIEKYEEKVREHEESLARQKRQNDAKVAMAWKMAELERAENEEKLKRDLALSRVKAQSESNTQSMLQEFAQRFNVSPEAGSGERHISNPGVTPNDGMKWLRSVSSRQSFGCNPDQNAQSPSPMPRSASDHTGLSSRAAGTGGCGMRGLQETTNDPPRSSHSSTGFNVLPGNRKNTGVSKFFSLPTYVSSEPSQLHSLPPEPSLGDLEEDFRSVGPASHSHGSMHQGQGQGPETQSQSQHSRGATQGSSRSQLVTETAHKKLEQDRFRSDCGQVDPSVLTPANPAKELHYHYHYYGNTEDRSQAKKKEQAPLNIVGAKVVQIGNDNTVKMLGGQVLEGLEEFGTDSEEEEEEEEDPPTVRKEPLREPGQPAVSGSQPPSTIYQDNNPSVAPHHPVPLPTRTPEPPQSTRTPEPPRPSHATAEGATPSQHVAPRNLNDQPKTQYVASSSAVSRTAQHLPPNSSAAGAPTVTSSGPVISGFGDMPSVQRHTNESLSSLPPQPSARVRPVGVAALMPRSVGGKGVGGSGDSTQGNISAVNEPAVSELQNVGMPPQGPSEMATESIESSPGEDEDPITEQTLAKQRALENEVD